MFNKEANLYVKKIELNNKEFYKQYNNISITPFFINMVNKYYEDQNMESHLEFDGKTKNYIDKTFEYRIKKQYDSTISNLYYHGKIIINKVKYNLKDFYIVFQNNSDYYIMCTDDRYHNDKLTYNKAFKFIDTTAFLNLINKATIKDNTIILDDSNTLENIVKKWDGKLNTAVAETDAIINKRTVGNGKYE